MDNPRLFDEPLIPTSESTEKDQALLDVEQAIRAECDRQSKSPAELFGKIIRQSLDEAIDGPRTGRWSIADLEKTEKTYVGTKIEIVARAALNLKQGKLMDTEIAGHPVDIKWSKKLAWQIPTEAVGHICLIIGTNERGSKFKVGLIRCYEDRLNPGKNKDMKRTISEEGRKHIRWLVDNGNLEPNFIAALDPIARRAVMSEKTAQDRVRKFLALMAGKPFPRSAIETVIHNIKDELISVPVDEIEEFIKRLNLGE